VLFGAATLRRVDVVLRFEDEELGWWVWGDVGGDGFEERFLKSPILR